MNRDLSPAQSYGIGRVYAEFQLKLNGAAPPTITEGASWVKSVAHTNGTNVVTVTMVDSFPKLVAHACDERDDANAGTYATIGTVTGEGSTTVPPAPITFKIQTFTAAGAVSNDSALVIVVSLAFRNSSIQSGSGN